ncbi:MAG: YitT family protein [Clostridia bacterium]|nr:YitT family protein [Clostridia bacterium]
MKLSELKDLSKKDVLTSVKNFLLVLLGTFVLAFGTGVFIIPFDLVVGGVSSIAIILDKLIGFAPLSVDFYVTVVTWLLFFAGLLFLGRDFALKTLLSTVVYPPALSLFMRLVSPDVFDGLFYLAGSEYQQIAILLAGIFGGAMIGAGCAITFLGGGSTGGVDVISLALCRKFKRLKSSVTVFVVDATIIALGALVVKNLVLTLLGIASAFIAALAIDKIFLGQTHAFIAHIVSDKHKEICDMIIRDLDRTATVISSKGAYSGEDKNMVMVSFSMPQYARLIANVKRIDETAFITVHRAHEINGEGWSY